ncbi:hypothetical protein [Streptomyces atratus]|uniref:hypothetical protein n=1 Tax=Streptomyces atratus TaxID=1893 RepID=UPI003659B1F0
MTRRDGDQPLREEETTWAWHGLRATAAFDPHFPGEALTEATDPDRRTHRLGRSHGIATTAASRRADGAAHRATP